MRSIFTILWDFEKLIYKVLMWLILVPKTIIKITLQPSWANDYVERQLILANKSDHETDEVPFDEYISPVLLLLVVALIPAFVFNFLPTFGSSISSPAETNPTTDRFLVFESVTDFKSLSTDMDYFHTWVVEKTQPDGSYAVVYREDHYPGNLNNFIEIVDNNTVKDRLLYTFPDLEAGEYFVEVYAGKYYPYRKDTPIVEIYKSYLKVTVPIKQDEQIVISSAGVRSVAADSADIGINITETTAQKVMQIVRLAAANVGAEKENMFFIALALMIPPLLFAFAIRFCVGRQVAEKTLKKDFYVQCYYYSVTSLAVWATFYAYYFFTADAYFYIPYGVVLQILLLPLVLTMLWFFRIEILTIANESQISGIKSFLVVAACFSIVGLGFYISFYFADFWDQLRLFYVQGYPLFSAALLIAFIYAWYGRRRAQGKNVTLRNIAWVFASFVVLVLAMNFLRTIATSLAPPIVATLQPTDKPPVEQTQIAQLPPFEQTQIAELPTNTPILLAYVPEFPDTPTPTLEEATSSPPLEIPITETFTVIPTISETPTSTFQPYYVEEFNSDIAGWTRFMTSGDERMIKETVALGTLSIAVNPMDDKLPWYYLINDNYKYSDVKVETVVTNRGVNANGISLICRYNDIGWYEFQFSYSGFYAIYAVDSVGIVNQGYNKLVEGSTTLVNPDFATNVLTAECKGSELSLYVNQALMQSIPETAFNFLQGKIGIAVSSPEKLPVNVDFDKLVVSEP